MIYRITSLALAFGIVLVTQLALGGVPSDVADYTATLNRIFTRGDVGITVGPEDGTKSLTFSPFILQADGTARATVKRFDRITNPQNSEFDLVLRKAAAGTFEFGLLFPGNEKEITYALRKIDDTHMSWADDVISPFKNEYTNGKWQLETNQFSISLNDQGRTSYILNNNIYELDSAYVAAHYIEVTPADGHRFLRDAATGEQVTFRAADTAELVHQGIVGAPVYKVLDWRQIAP